MQSVQATHLHDDRQTPVRELAGLVNDRIAEVEKAERDVRSTVESLTEELIQKLHCG